MNANMIYYFKTPQRVILKFFLLNFVSLPPVFSTNEWLTSITELTPEVTNGFISQRKLKWEPGPGLASCGSLVLPSLASCLSVRCSLMKERHVLSKATSSQCQPHTGVQHSQYPEEAKGKKDSGEAAATLNSVNMHYQWGTTMVLRWPQSQRQGESPPRPREPTQTSRATAGPYNGGAQPEAINLRGSRLAHD